MIRAVAILVVVMIVTLVVALVANSLPLAYLSILCSAAAAVLLIVSTVGKIRAYKGR